jgi:hypothetical protein
VLVLIKPCVDAETVETLQGLLKEAQAGRIVGMAYVALLRQNQYQGDLVGTAKTTPLLARGLCRALEDAISSPVKHR